MAKFNPGYDLSGITSYLRVLDLESLLTAEPSTAKDWIYPLKEVLFISLELPMALLICFGQYFS